jgi:hypothetical protein
VEGVWEAEMRLAIIVEAQGILPAWIATDPGLKNATRLGVS